MHGETVKSNVDQSRKSSATTWEHKPHTRLVEEPETDQMEGLHVDGMRILNWVLKRNRLGGRELDSAGLKETTGGTFRARSWRFRVYKTREIPPPPPPKKNGLWSMEFKLSSPELCNFCILYGIVKRFKKLTYNSCSQ